MHTSWTSHSSRCLLFCRDALTDLALYPLFFIMLRLCCGYWRLRSRSVYLRNMKFLVRFTFSRVPLRLQHQGLAAAQGLPSAVLFPSSVALLLSRSTLASPSALSNDTLNPEQQAAVRHIMEARARPAPYILFGPPGKWRPRSRCLFTSSTMRCVSRSVMCPRRNYCQSSRGALALVAALMQTVFLLVIGVSTTVKLQTSGRTPNH